MNTTEMNREYHPVADIFPLMEGDEYEELKRDIAANGLLNAIWLHPDGRIIDGRNRYRACIETETAPRFETWSGNGSVISLALSLNMKRRHLSITQRTVTGVEILPMLEEEAKERMSEGGKQGKVKLPYLEDTGQSRDYAAKIVDVSPSYISQGKHIKENAPDLFEDMKSGVKTITQAKRALTARNKKDTPPLPDEKYRVIYADPPWKYGNTMPDYMGVQDDHYPTMTVSELCQLPICDLVADDAVLFLWVTSPILEESFALVNAWGFKYKASFIWDKVKHVMGHYNSVRHEVLLICVRGSCQPDVQKLFDSVQTIERQKHSAKPVEFREIIDTIYPYGKRIELFAREENDNWEIWGNEYTTK